MKLDPQDLKKIALLTLEHYNLHAEEFWKGTRYHNVSQNIEALLQHIKGKPPFTILDFGCGPGRDLKALVEQGHNVIGLEGDEHFVTMARAHSECEVWRQDFLNPHCRRNISMVCSPTPRCFMSRGKNCRACCWNCTPL